VFTRKYKNQIERVLLAVVGKVVFALCMGMDLVQDRASGNGSELNSTFSFSYVSFVVFGVTRLA